jgi:hypothetical protein
LDPFIKFLKQVLLRNGASPNAYVMKLKQYRDDVNPVLNASQMTNSTQMMMMPIQARRPPEKEQYTSETLGLSNALHMLIDTPNVKLF